MGQAVNYIAKQPTFLVEEPDVQLNDDFNRGFDSTNCWNTVLTGSSTAAAAAGILTLTTQGNANDETYLFSRQVLFTPAAALNFRMDAFVQYTEQNVSQANVFFGIMSGVATGAFQSAGAGLKTTGTIIGIYKKSSDLYWRGHAQNPSGSSTAQDTLSTSACGLSTYTRLSIEVFMSQGLQAEIAYRVDGALLRDTNNQNFPIRHVLDLTSAAGAELCFLLRAGSTNTVAEFANVDWLNGNIKRANNIY